MRLAMSVGSFERRNIVVQADFVQHAERRFTRGVSGTERSTSPTCVGYASSSRRTPGFRQRHSG